MRRLTLSKKAALFREQGATVANGQPLHLQPEVFSPTHMPSGKTLRNLIRTCGRELCKALQSEPPGLSRAAVSLSSSSDMQGRPHQEDDEQVGRVEGVEEPLRNLGLHVGGQEDQRRGQEGKDLKADGVSPTTRAIGSSRDPPQRAGR